MLASGDFTVEASQRIAGQGSGNLLTSGSMTDSKRRIWLFVATTTTFFIVFMGIGLLLQVIFGDEITAGSIRGQVIMAVIATVLFVLLPRWWRRRSRRHQLTD